jgi:Integrase zinc binding domain
LGSSSSFAKVVRIAAIIFWLHNKKQEKYLSAEEIEYAGNRLLLLAQQQASFTNKRYKNFKTIMENGLIKIATRIGNSCAVPETIKPILLHHEDIICQRILTDIHKKKLHGGPSRMVYEYRQDFFTPAVKKLAKKIVSECAICTRYANNPHVHEISVLPRPRVRPQGVFFYTGIDMAGPFVVKEFGDKLYRTRKIWMLLCTCLTSRAIHLEMLLDCSAVGLNNALQNFFARRNTPKYIFSDNGGNMVGCKRMVNKNSALSNLIELPYTQDKLAGSKITWNTILERAPNFGGAWEVIIREVKRFFIKMTGSRQLTLYEFQCLLCRIEAVVNSKL